MTDATVIAAKQLMDEGLTENSTGEVGGVLRIVVCLTPAGVKYRTQGGR